MRWNRNNRKVCYVWHWLHSQLWFWGVRGKNDRRDKKMPLELIFISGGVDVSLGVMLVFEFTICRTQTNVPLAPTTVEPWDLDTCAGTSRYYHHAGDRKKILENENCSGILPLREETVQRGWDLGRERALHKVVKKYAPSLLWHLCSLGQH